MEWLEVEENGGSCAGDVKDAGTGVEDVGSEWSNSEKGIDA